MVKLFLFVQGPVLFFLLCFTSVLVFFGMFFGMFCVGILGHLGRRTGPTCFARAFLGPQFVFGGRRHVLYGGIKTDMVVVVVLCGGGLAVSATRP